ncbi:hypothetical protein GOY13_01875 [Wolbachia endosymbiont of Cruorifilaria tuberocauda]|uniref:actin-bundling T4SS effector WalE1 family protein n=1 Tax=Wolbachia endosymbiont of Cruorifilaria tuberocauda TaxID=1812111 RepID=UPI0015888ED5|nr:hypothetical protein [Wolbachia endosymbiont of Cruorifilaria tuberocauda]QKX01683.1 hypothetical protein GOY13_01875 [Wolbachia endosymbiont of Cruorifilaria tuberocauda]
MLGQNEINPGVIDAQLQQNQQHGNYAPLALYDLLQQMQSLEKKVKSLEVMNMVTLSLLIGTAVIGANFSIVASPVIAGSIVGGIFATVLFTALGMAVHKHKIEIKNGFKYATDKTRGGAVYAKDSVKEAISYMGQTVREGTSSTLKVIGNKVSNFGKNMSDLDKISYLGEHKDQAVVLKTAAKTENFNNIKEMFFREVFEDKTVGNSVLTKKIFSELKGKILEKAYSVDDQHGFKKDRLINQLGQQADFVNRLSAKKLQNLLAQDDNNLYEIFSEHHNEIMKIIKESKIEYKLSSIIEKLNGTAKKYGSKKGLIRSVGSSLESSLSDVDSIKTDSTAVVSSSSSQGFGMVNSNFLARSPSSSSLSSSSTNWGVDSFGFSPKLVIATGSDSKVKTQDGLKRVDCMDKLRRKQQPSTDMSVEADVQPYIPMKVPAVANRCK